MPPRQRKKYTGILAEPIDLSGGIDVWGPEMERRFDALFEHYGIERRGELEREDLIKLVWALAGDHVPGFRPPPEQRKPRLANILRDLLSFYELWRADIAGKSVSEAAEHFAARWRRLGYEVTAEAIRRRYYEIKDNDAERKRLHALVDDWGARIK